MDEHIKKRRGRPLGHILSDTTKSKIRVSRIGRPHSKETRNKIARSLTLYFKHRNPISESFDRDYRNFPKEITAWLINNRSALDESEDIMPNKRLMYISQSEVSYGPDIENFYHFSTPEFLLLFKEDLILNHLTDELEEFNSIIS
jgi:hypothetical protein